MAGQPATAALTRVGIALHLIGPSFDAGLFRTGGLRALGLTLASSAKVFKSPDMTAWGGIFQGSKRKENNPFTYRRFQCNLSPNFLEDFKIFFSAATIDLWIH